MSEPLRENLPEIEQNAEAPVQEKMPLAWHGFLTKFMLWLQAALHLSQAGWILSGKIYYTPEVLEAVYTGLPVMRIVDYALAALLILAAILLIAAAVGLKKRKAAGIKRLLSAYILLSAAWIAYGAARFLFAGLSPISIPVAGQPLLFIALLLVNRSYYRKRSALFS